MACLLRFYSLFAEAINPCQLGYSVTVWLQCGIVATVWQRDSVATVWQRDSVATVWQATSESLIVVTIYFQQPQRVY